MLLRNLMLGLCLSGCVCGPSLAQERSAAAQLAEEAEVARYRVRGLSATPPTTALIREPAFPGQQAAITLLRGNPVNGKLREAIKKYRDSKDDSEAREEAKGDVETALSEQYDSLLKNQEAQLDEMEKKLTELRQQLKERKAAKQKMVELKLEMVLAQLDGLGWPDSNESSWLGSGMNRVFERGFMETQPSLPSLAPAAPLPPADLIEERRSEEGRRSR